jgi:hypothetical protein
VVGFFVTLPQTPVYQARTSIEIQGFNDNFLNMRQSSVKGGVKVFRCGGGKGDHPGCSSSSVS